MFFCIFSFNRGIYLKNCIQSIEKCFPESEVAVFDDNSNDPETLNVLNEVSGKHDVIKPEKNSNSRHHLGGLYGNMQYALEYCKDKKLVCFLQDDTQVVRPVSSKETEEINQIFEQNQDLGFLHPCFIKKTNLSQGESYTYDESADVYFRDPTSRSAGRYFSALLITRPSRLMEVDWKFTSSEPANSRLAEEYFLPMGYLKNPFAMWLPEVPAYRGKKKTLALKLAEKKRNCGFYPFRIMSQNEVEKLLLRDLSVLPVAENYLACQEAEPPKPWTYNPLTREKGLKVLNKLEISLKKLIK
ncbi:MAG: glycosyltransferase [Candidatus Muiribacteriota bacterium]